MDFINYITTNWLALGAVLYGAMSLAGQIVGLFDGPGADKARGVFDYILGLLRNFGLGTYKDEPGTTSIPFKGDTGQRITQ